MKLLLDRRSRTKKILTGLVLLALIFIILYLLTAPGEPVLPSPLLEKIDKTISIVTAYYVEKKAPEDLIQNAFKGMAAGLDEGSDYLTPFEYCQLKAEAESGYVGIGVRLGRKNGYPHIEQVLPDSPAKEARLRRLDRLIAVDGRDAGRVSLRDAVRWIEGPPASPVTLLVYREGFPAHGKEFRLIRRAVVRSSIGVVFFEKGLGYIQLQDFARHTPLKTAELVSALSQEGGFRGLVIDLRGNSGGVFEAAVETAKLFLERDRLIARTAGKRKSDNQKFRTKETGRFSSLPLVLLVDGQTASSAEVFAAALQENGRARVFGERTYGKASIQTVFPFQDGSALRITTSHYFTPSGHLIEGTGILPDAAVPAARELPGKESAARRDPVFRIARESLLSREGNHAA